MFRALNLGRDEKGQSLVEVSAGVVFLILVIIIVFEAGIVFSTYIALLNASREGAVYASRHPEMAPGDAAYAEYLNVVKNEARAAGLDVEGVLQIDPPTSNTTLRVPSITVTVHYQVVTFTSTIRLPWFGRLGLPEAWPISARTTMPIRGG